MMGTRTMWSPALGLAGPKALSRAEQTAQTLQPGSHQGRVRSPEPIVCCFQQSTEVPGLT